MDKRAKKYDFLEIARRSVPQFASGEWEYLASAPTYDLQERGDSAIGSFSISYHASGQDKTTANLVARLYKKRETRSRAAYEGMLRLREAGFRAPSPFRIAQPYGYSLDPPVLFVEKAAGTSWQELIFGSREESLSSSRRAADWLLRLHESDIPSIHRANRRVITARVQRFAVELSPMFPALAPRLYSLSHTIAQALLQPGPLRPSHGNFHAGNMFLTPDFATCIDFDNLALREAAFDVGYTMGYLLMSSWYKTDSHDAGARAADAFLERYLSRGKLSVPRVRLHIGRSIFQSVHFSYVKHTPRHKEIESCLDLVEQFVETGGRMPILETRGRRKVADISVSYP